MRLYGRVYFGPKPACSFASLSLLFTLSACSLPDTIPDVIIDRQAKRATEAGEGFSGNGGDYHCAPHCGDSTYLATVHVRFADYANHPITFDVRKDRSDLISVNMLQTEETSTYLHLGYNHGEGGIAGLRFNWRF